MPAHRAQTVTRNTGQPNDHRSTKYRFYKREEKQIQVQELTLKASQRADKIVEVSIRGKASVPD